MITLTSYPQGDTNSHYYAAANPLTHKFNMTGRGAGAFNAYDITAQAGLSAFLVSVGLTYTAGETVLITPDQAKLINVGDVVMINESIMTNVTKKIDTGVAITTLVVSPPHNILTAEPIDFKSVNNYRAEFRVFHGRKELTSGGDQIMEQVGPVIESTPDNSGNVLFNVQPFIRPFIDPEMRLNPVRKNTVGINNWGRFFIQWRERYDGDGLTEETGWTPGTPGPSNMRWYVAAVRQLQNGGVTLFPYNQIALGELKGSFLTAFKEPEYIVGFSENELSFVWPIANELEGLRVKEEKLNSTLGVISSATAPLLPDGVEEVNRVRLAVHTSAFVRVEIETDPGYLEGYVQPGYVLIGYFELI